MVNEVILLICIVQGNQWILSSSNLWFCRKMVNSENYLIPELLGSVWHIKVAPCSIDSFTERAHLITLFSHTVSPIPATESCSCLLWTWKKGKDFLYRQTWEDGEGSGGGDSVGRLKRAAKGQKDKYKVTRKWCSNFWFEIGIFAASEIWLTSQDTR